MGWAGPQARDSQEPGGGKGMEAMGWAETCPPPELRADPLALVHNAEEERRARRGEGKQESLCSIS